MISDTLFGPMKRNQLLFIILTGIIILIIIVKNILTPCRYIQCLTLVNRNTYALKDTYQNTNRSFRGLYVSGQNYLRASIEQYDMPEQAERLINAEITRMKGLFEKAPSPYPGEISDAIECTGIFKPVYSVRHNATTEFFQIDGYLNDRLVFGSCTEDQARYKDIMILFNCPKQKKIYELEFIYPRLSYEQNSKQFQQIVETVSCK